MKYLYCIYDSKAQFYHPPRYFYTDEEAIRTYAYNVNTPSENDMLHSNAEDFILFRVGSFDEKTGKLEPEALPISIVSLHSLKKHQPVSNKLS